MSDEWKPIADRYAKRREDRELVEACWRAWERLKAFAPRDGRVPEDRVRPPNASMLDAEEP